MPTPEARRRRQLIEDLTVDIGDPYYDNRIVNELIGGYGNVDEGGIGSAVTRLIRGGVQALRGGGTRGLRGVLRTGSTVPRTHLPPRPAPARQIRPGQRIPRTSDSGAIPSREAGRAATQARRAANPQTRTAGGQFGPKAPTPRPGPQPGARLVGPQAARGSAGQLPNLRALSGRQQLGRLAGAGAAGTAAAGMLAEGLSPSREGGETSRPSDMQIRRMLRGDGVTSQGSQGTTEPMDGWHARMQLGEGPRPSSGQPEPEPYIDPYQEFLRDQMAALSSAYDDQISAIAGLDPIFRDMARESQDRIGGFFDDAVGAAQAGIPVTQDIYDTASGNVGGIYDDLGERLGDLPATISDAARRAGGPGMDSAIADRVAAASAPFVAAGEASRADALANLTQHSSAGQNYLNQLASAAPAEGAMHQSAVDQALNVQLQQVAMRQAELEGQKQRALMEITSDLAGSSAEMMANQALSQALGLGDLGPGVSPLDFLRGQQMIQGMMPDAGDPIAAERERLALARDQARYERDLLDLEERLNPNWQQDQLLSSLSPEAQSMYRNLLSTVESGIDLTIPGASSPSPRDMGLLMVQELDRMFGLDAEDSQGLPDPEGPITRMIGADRYINAYHEVQDAIRRLYGN